MAMQGSVPVDVRLGVKLQRHELGDKERPALGVQLTWCVPRDSRQFGPLVTHLKNLQTKRREDEFSLLSDLVFLVQFCE